MTPWLVLAVGVCSGWLVWFGLRGRSKAERYQMTERDIRRYRVASVEYFHASEAARLRGDEREARRLLQTGLAVISAMKEYDDEVRGPMG